MVFLQDTNYMVFLKDVRDECILGKSLLCKRSTVYFMEFFHEVITNTFYGVLTGRKHGGRRGPRECFMGSQLHKGG